MSRLEILSKFCSFKMNINYTFEGDLIVFIDPKENELHTIKSNNVDTTSVHNLDSYLDYMKERDFETFTNYLKSILYN